MRRIGAHRRIVADCSAQPFASDVQSVTAFGRKQIILQRTATSGRRSGRATRMPSSRPRSSRPRTGDQQDDLCSIRYELIGSTLMEPGRNVGLDRSAGRPHRMVASPPKCDGMRLFWGLASFDDNSCQAGIHQSAARRSGEAYAARTGFLSVALHQIKQRCGRANCANASPVFPVR